MSAGSGPDLFVFGRSQGHDLVADFEDGIDRLDLRAFGLAGIGEVSAADSTAGMVVDLGAGYGGTITLAGMTMAQLDSADVLL